MTPTGSGPRPPTPADPPGVAPITTGRGFAALFRRFISVTAVSFAALPILITQARLIPAFKSMREVLSIYNALVYLLASSAVFFSRHGFARWMFPPREPDGRRAINRWFQAVPLACIALTVVGIVSYHDALARSINVTKGMKYHEQLIAISTREVLDETPIDEVRFQTEILLSYIGIFLFSGLAVTVVALKEYLQDSLRLDDPALFDGPDRLPGKPLKTGSGADDV